MIRSSRNQLGNVANKHQTEAKRVLVVCSGGLLRSPTGANVLHREFGYNTRAAGSSEPFALIHVTEALILWADEIVFVNPANFQECLYSNGEYDYMIREKAVVLQIEDEFEWNNRELQEMFINQYQEKLNNGS